MEKKDKFDYTPDGVKNATSYLKEAGEWESTKRGFSVDGWSVVMTANDVYKKLNPEAKDTRRLPTKCHKCGYHGCVCKKLKSIEEHNSSRYYYSSGNPKPSGVAYPKCGEELIMPEPNSTLTSNPPKKAVVCAGTGCSYSGFINA